MVGTRTSTGCDTCRQRKKKCGKELPGCKACLANGWKCPGYARSWRFVSENDQLSQYFRKKKYLFDSEQTSLDDGMLALPHGKAFGFNLHVFSILRPPPLTPAERTGGIFVHILTDPRSLSVFSPQAAAGVFPLIPVRLGHNAALDAAVSCLCSIYGDLGIGGEASTTTMRNYGACLSKLRTFVTDSVLQAESETICASIVVQICEMTLSPNTGNYDVLLKGCRALMQKAGPERFHTGFERAMLELQRPPFIAQDIANGRACFLSEPEWRALPQRSPQSSCTANFSLRLRSELCDLMIELPDLTSRVYAIGNSPGEDNAAYLKTLTTRATDLKRRVQTWYESAVLPYIPFKVPEGSGDITTATEREYPALLFAVVDCVACALLVKLDDVTATLDNAYSSFDPRVLLSPESTEYIMRQEIIRSATRYVQNHSAATAKCLRFGQKTLDYTPTLDGMA